MPGAPLDDAVETPFLGTMVPSEIELSLAVSADVAARSDALDEHRRLRRDQAAYEARRAERRYKAVDPDNRVVARTLEREWKERLKEAEEVTRQHTGARREKRVDPPTKIVRAFGRSRQMSGGVASDNDDTRGTRSDAPARDRSDQRDTDRGATPCDEDARAVEERRGY